MSSTSGKYRKTPPRSNGAFVYKPAADGVDENLLVLLHGLGDRPENFINFGVKMQLPQTAILALRGPSPIPFHDGTGWVPAFSPNGDDLSYSDASVGAGLATTRTFIKDILEKLILESASNPNGWSPDRIFLFGFSQGGMAAIDQVLFGTSGLGGAISISGWPSQDLYPKTPETVNKNAKLLITQGLNDDVITQSQWRQRASYLKDLVPSATVTICEILGKGHAMPQKSDEMRAIMQFFGSNLALRNLKLESQADVYELQPGT
ncbi:Alpha/Beta hydrolase protein [Phlyctochytrium arcticum]|nr:Alpha/Beta hydrolase protein [Phlyctochytrium arcticum]